MKQRFLIMGVCLILAATMCLSVSWPRSEGSLPLPTKPTDSTASSDTEPTEPLPTQLRLHVADEEKLAQYQLLAEQYSQETGITVTVLTGSLDALMEESAPTIFTLTDSDSLALWQDRLLDLTGTEVLSKLSNESFALTAGGVPVGIALDVTGYGLVYNASLLAQVAHTRTDISDFSVLKTVAEHITGKASTLGFRPFGCLDWENEAFVAMLAGLGDDPQQLRGFLELYLANDTATGTPLESFLAQKTAFYVGGIWEYEALEALGSNNLDILPLYTADGGSLHYICRLYWCVNAQAEPREIEAALDFLSWMATATENGPAPVDALGYFAPFADAATAANSFQRLLRKYMATDPATLHWSLESAAPENLSDALRSYCADPTDENWEAVAALLAK